MGPYFNDPQLPRAIERRPKEKMRNLTPPLDTRLGRPRTLVGVLVGRG